MAFVIGALTFLAGVWFGSWLEWKATNSQPPTIKLPARKKPEHDKPAPKPKAL